MKHRIGLVLSVLMLAVGLQAAEKQYIVTLSKQPTALVVTGLKSKAAISQRQAVQAQQQATRDEIEKRMHGHVVRAFQTVLNGLVVRVDDSRLDELRSLSGVVRVKEDRMRHWLTLDMADRVSHSHLLRQHLGLQSDDMGRGIKIAILDTGIDITNPMFDDTGFSLPDGFDPGADNDASLTNNKVIVAKNFGSASDASDMYGHGTASASCAAGREAAVAWGSYTYTIRGAAPGAWLGNYKVFNSPATGDPGAQESWILAGIDAAVNDGMNVINMSLGGDATQSAMNDNEVLAVENAVAAGVVVCISAGNEGYVVSEDAQGNPIWSTYDLNEESIGSPGIAPSAITVGATQNGRTIPGQATIMVDGAPVPSGLNSFSFGYDTRVSINLETYGPAELVDITDYGVTETGCDPYPSGVDLSGKVAFIKRGDCMFCQKIYNAEQAGAIAVVVYNHTPDGIDNGGILNMDVGGVDCAPYQTSIPGFFIRKEEGDQIKSLLDDGDRVLISFAKYPAISAGYKSSFSSIGPTPVDFNLKPDLAAVGQHLTLATQSINSNGGMYDETGFTILAAGTSFSSPLTAGYAAVMLQQNGSLTPAQVKSVLANTADWTHNYHQTQKGTDHVSYYGGYASPVFQGGGRINMERAYHARVAFEPSSVGFGKVDISSGASGSVDGVITIRNLTNETVSLQPSLLPIIDNDHATASLSSTGVITIQAGGTATLTLTASYTDPVASDMQGYVLFQDNYGNEYQVPYFARMMSDITGETSNSDSDGDGLTKSEERFMGTDIFMADTDGDEVNVNMTDPTNATSGADFPIYGNTVYIPLSTTDYDREGNMLTDVYVVNTGFTGGHVVAYFYDTQGNLVQYPQAMDLPAHGWRRIVASSDLDPAGHGWVMVQSDRDIRAFANFRSVDLNGTIQHAFAVPGTSTLDSNLYVPHVASRTNQWVTNIGIVNATGGQVAATYTPHGGTAQPISFFGLPGSATYQDVVGFLYGGQYPFDGTDQSHWWGEITQDSGAKAPALVGMESFIQIREDQHMNQAAGLLLNDTATTDFIISHVTSKWLWWTGIAVNNLSDTTASVTFTPYDNTGTALTPVTFQMDAGAKAVNLVEGFWTGNGLTFPEDTAWIRITSDQNITGYELFGIDSSGDSSDNRDALAGVEALVEPSDTLSFPYTPKSDSREWSGIVLLNASDTVTNVSIRAYNALGEEVARVSKILKSGERVVSVVDDDLFGGLSQDVRWIQVVSDTPIYGFELFGGQDFLYLSGIPAL